MNQPEKGQEWSHVRTKQTFVDYFETKSHAVVLSSPLVPENDNSLLFTNSGMVQFKNIFLGKEHPKHDRACNVQQCIRAGGKHNDLDDVGKDSYHHTLFNMLGNWSFNYTETGNNGAYFKKGAINMAWDLLTNIYKINKNRLYVTYFGGDCDLNLEPDEETKNLWLQHLPENRVLPFGMKDNFWEMDSYGPCGSCTEIHYDKLGNREASDLVNMNDPTVIELWNLVFVQYNRHQDGTITTLNNKHVDCGMGLERLVSVLNGCTNYEIDAFTQINNIITKITNGPTYTDKYGLDDPKFTDTAYRVIADHLRTMIFAINDGILPGATGRNYVIRRLIRRAVRYGTKLEATVGFLYKIVHELIALLIYDNSRLMDNIEIITNVIRDEEIKFSKVMGKGLRLFYKLVLNNGQKIPTKRLLELSTTYGFPMDIIKQLCEECTVEFNIVEYNELMAAHIQKSRGIQPVNGPGCEGPIR